jgi:hypothetical protein
MDIRWRSLPFPHILAASVFSEADHLGLIARLDACRWHPETGDFFTFDTLENYVEEVSLLSFLLGKSEEHNLLAVLQDVFNIPLFSPREVEFHRYRAKSGIGAHADTPARQVRFVINLNRHWHVTDGGIWIVASDSQLKSGRQFIPPISNTGFAFPTSTSSYHAMSVRNSETSYGVTIKYPLSIC